jgi:hypothetical protein
MTGRRTRRQVTHAEAEQAVERIALRRRQHGDPDEERIGDEALGMVEYVLACQQVHAGVLAEDVVDALVLLEYVRDHVAALPRQLDRYEHDLLSTGLKSGLSMADLAKPLGLRTRQAVEHRLLRYRSAERGGVRHEAVEREARARERAEHNWCYLHGGQLIAAATLLLKRRQVFADAGLGEDLDDLATTLGDVTHPGDDEYPKVIRYLAIRVRLLAADAQDWEEVNDRTQDRPLTRLLNRANAVAAGHRQFV